MSASERGFPENPKSGYFCKKPLFSQILLDIRSRNFAYSIRMAAKRVILITGSTDGIGKQTALELAKNSENHIIIHGRDENRCRNTVDTIKSSTGNGKIDHVVADFARMKSVHDMAGEVQRRFPRLNVLICNAGVLLPQRQLSHDGLETTFQVNHLAHFLLTTKLCGLLKQNRPSRLIVVSSICYNWHPMDWTDFNAEKEYEKYLQYSRTKLMNHLFAFALARRFANDPEIPKGSVTSNVLEPGVVQTKLLHAGGYSGGPVDQGAITPVYLAQSPDVDGVNGEYFNNSKQKLKANEASRDEVAQEKLWTMSEEMCMNLGVW